MRAIDLLAALPAFSAAAAAYHGFRRDRQSFPYQGVELSCRSTCLQTAPILQFPAFRSSKPRRDLPAHLPFSVSNWPNVVRAICLIARRSWIKVLTGGLVEVIMSRRQHVGHLL